MNYDDFTTDFKPYRGKYIKQFEVKVEDYLFPESNYEWRTVKKYLKRSYIEKAIAGLAVIGWFNNLKPNVIGIDIDDHRGQAWAGVAPSPQLLSKYNQILQRFPEPSQLVQSPRGLHLYYVLNDRLPSNLI